MTDKEIKEMFKDFPELRKEWEKITSNNIESQRKTEEEMYRYRMLRERELRKESLPEPEFTKAKRAEPTSEVTSEISELEKAAKRYATEGDEISGLYIIEPEVDAFKAGAEWDKKRIINKAIGWIEKQFNMPNDFAEKFRKAMEE